jgi:cytochrome c oxidase subunit 4
MQNDSTSHTVIPVRTYVLIWAILMFLLIATIGLDFMNLGWGNTAVALGIAAVKAMLVATFFMHLRYNPRLNCVFASAGIFWLGILITLSLSDYITRT